LDVFLIFFKEEITAQEHNLIVNILMLYTGITWSFLVQNFVYSFPLDHWFPVLFPEQLIYYTKSWSFKERIEIYVRLQLQ
jgi:hypothetical protein